MGKLVPLVLSPTERICLEWSISSPHLFIKNSALKTTRLIIRLLSSEMMMMIIYFVEWLNLSELIWMAGPLLDALNIAILGNSVRRPWLCTEPQFRVELSFSVMITTTWRNHWSTYQYLHHLLLIDLFRKFES